MCLLVSCSASCLSLLLLLLLSSFFLRCTVLLYPRLHSALFFSAFCSARPCYSLVCSALFVSDIALLLLCSALSTLVLPCSALLCSALPCYYLLCSSSLLCSFALCCCYAVALLLLFCALLFSSLVCSALFLRPSPRFLLSSPLLCPDPLCAPLLRSSFALLPLMAVALFNHPSHPHTGRPSASYPSAPPSSSQAVLTPAPPPTTTTAASIWPPTNPSGFQGG